MFTHANSVGFDRERHTMTGQDLNPVHLLYQLHPGDCSKDEVGALQRALDDAADAGLIRAYGGSTDRMEHFNLFERTPNSCRWARKRTWPASVVVGWRWGCAPASTSWTRCWLATTGDNSRDDDQRLSWLWARCPCTVPTPGCKGTRASQSKCGRDGRSGRCESSRRQRSTDLSAGKG